MRMTHARSVTAALPSRLLAALVGVIGVVGVVAGAAVPPSAGADPLPPVWDRGDDHYVAIGDSFASGPGIAPQRASGCARSERNYATLVATALDANRFTDASCGGARTTHLTDPQAAGEVTNPPQLDAIDADTTLVTFGTLGGNDLGLVGLATSCVAGDCVPEAGEDPYASQIETVRTNMTAGLEAARAAAPDAAIYVIGYGTYVPPGGCPAAFGGLLTAEEFDYLQSQIDRLSDVLGEVAATAGVQFVDLRALPGAADHTVCAAPEDQWIRALATHGDGSPFHPSACGMDAVAQHLLRTVQADRGLDVTPFDDTCVSAGGPVDPSPAELKRAELEQAAATTAVATWCVGRGPARTLHVRVRGGGGLVTRVVVTVGGAVIGRGTGTPYLVSRLARRVGPGRIAARVVLEGELVTVTTALAGRRPRCLR